MGRGLNIAHFEAAMFFALGATVLATHRTVTSAVVSLRQHPAGLLVIGAATGALVAHLWFDETVARPRPLK